MSARWSSLLDTLNAWETRLVAVPRQGLMALVRLYRLLLKPWLGNACRFEPTCSAYMLQALQRHGAVRGTALGSWRLLRCHPWCVGGLDPVPDNRAGLFTRLLPAPAGVGGTEPRDSRADEATAAAAPAVPGHTPDTRVQDHRVPTRTPS